MEIKEYNFVFQTDSEIVRKTYYEDNYLIAYNYLCLDKNTCAIYFSSNDIYFPNSEDVFRKKIVEKNFYEWFNTRIQNAYKHIFLRDIQKQWYVAGINNRINNPELLLEFLTRETKGYSIITIGSSAGGYAAVLYGSLLNARRVFSFNGQFEVDSLLKKSNSLTDPLLFRNKEFAVAKYFDLRGFINRDIEIYYFSSLYSEWDNQQYNYIKDINSIHPILFKTANHGIPFIKSALPIVINMQKIVLDKLVGKKHNPIIFSIEKAGLFATVDSVYTQIKNKLLK